MALTSAHTLTLTASTLAEVREFIRATDHLPDTATVRARTRFGANPDGSLLRQLHVSDSGTNGGQALVATYDATAGRVRFDESRPEQT